MKTLPIFICLFISLTTFAQEQVPRNILTDNFTREQLAEVLVEPGEWKPFPGFDRREVWEGLPDQYRDALILEAENFLDYHWPVIPATTALDFNRTGGRSVYSGISFGRRRALAALIVGELMENQGRFLDQIVNGIWAISEETYWGISAHVGGLPDVQDPVVDLFAAETAALFAYTDYLLGERLERIHPLIRERIYYETKRRVLDPALQHKDFWWMGYRDRSLNNWTTWICSNWLPAVLLLEKDRERQEDTVWKIMDILDNFLNAYPSDGGCDEGPSYWNAAGGCLYDCLNNLKDASGSQIDLFDEPLIREIGLYVVRVYIDYPYYINFADASAMVRHDPTLIYRFGKALDEPRMKGMGAFLFKQEDELSVLTEPRFGYLGRRQIPGLLTLEEIDAYPAEEPLPDDFWLPDLQVMGARSVPGSNEGFYLAAKGGHNAESHNHNDVGNFIVYHDGTPVIVDAGVETYTAKTFSSERYSIWTMQSAYHNLPTLNGTMQRNGREYRAMEVSFNAKRRKVEFELDLAGAYPEEAGITSYQRSLELKRNKEIRVTDRYEFGQPENDLVMNLLCYFDPHKKHQGVIRLQSRDNSRKVIHLMYDPEFFEVTIERINIENSRLYRVWNDHLSRIQLRAKNPGQKGNFKLVVSE